MEFPDPPYDLLRARLVHTKVDGTGPVVLLVGDGDVSEPVLVDGGVVLRYGVAFLYRANASLIPQWGFDDFRQEYTGFAVLDFIYGQGDRFPRADVIGWDAKDGKRIDVFMKELDLARPPRTFGYADTNVRSPASRIHAAVWIDDEANEWQKLMQEDDRVPLYLARSMPCYSLPPSHINDLTEYVFGIFE